MNYTLNLKSNPNNPTYISVFNQQLAAQFTSKPKARFGVRMQQLFSSASIELEHVITQSQPLHPGNTTYHLSYFTSIPIMINHAPLQNSF